MALPSPQTKPAEPGAAEYFSWQAPGAPASVKMHFDVVDAMTADVIEGFNALPRRGVEVGGFLVGRRENATIFIDRFECVTCEYRFGPSYILSEHDKARFQETWARLYGDEKLSIVGFYRSHTRKNLQLEQSDLELLNRWFDDPASVFLVVKPIDITHLTAEFFFWENGALPMQSAGNEFAFRGRGAGMVTEAQPLIVATRRDAPVVPSEPAVVPSQPAPPDGNAGPKTVHTVPVPAPAFTRPPISLPTERNFFSRYWEAITALLLVLCAAGLFWWQHSSDSDSGTADGSAPAASGSSSVAPSSSTTQGSNAGSAPTASTSPPVSLGLEVRPGPGEWQVTWKRDLPPIRNARRGVLAIQDGGTRKQLDLDANQLRAGSIPYRASSDDVTFRLEVFGQDNRSSKESFRVLLASKPGNTPAAVTAAPPPTQKSPEKPAVTASIRPALEKPSIPDLSKSAAAQTPAPLPGALPSPLPARTPPVSAPANPPAGAPERPKPAPRIIPAEVASRERPEVPEGIRSRITEDMVVLVKVTIDTNGRVSHAEPVTRGDGLTSYLARRASEAALKWRFEPARQNDRPVSSSQVIRFVFEK